MYRAICIVLAVWIVGMGLLAIKQDKTIRSLMIQNENLEKLNAELVAGKITFKYKGGQYQVVCK